MLPLDLKPSSDGCQVIVNPTKLAGAAFGQSLARDGRRTPNYAARLLKHLPVLGRYVALGYFVGWVTAPATYATILTDLIKTNLELPLRYAAIQN